jgi:transcriptional antiterminator
MNLLLYQRLNDLISQKCTGPVDSLAEKLDVSPRKVKYMIKMMKENCGSPIHFDFIKQSYVYSTDGCCDFRFHTSKREYITEAVTEALRQCLSTLIITVFFSSELMDMSVFCPGLFE